MEQERETKTPGAGGSRLRRRMRGFLAYQVAALFALVAPEATDTAMRKELAGRRSSDPDPQSPESAAPSTRPITPPSCETCVHHVWDRGDSDVGIGPSVECDNDAVSLSLLDTESDPVARAARCGFYQVVMADKCGYCGKPLNLPITEVQFWCAHVYDEPSPGCSAECANAADEQAARIFRGDRGQLPRPKGRSLKELG